MVNRVSSTHSTSVNRLLPIILIVLLVGSILPMTAPSSPSSVDDSVLDNEPVVSPVGSDCNTCQSYNLYLDEMTSETGGDGSITTEEPSGSQQDMSALGGIQFRSNEMISDLLVYGRGSTDKVTLTIFLQFKGTEGSSADVTYSLEAGGTEIDSQSKNFDDPCTGNIITAGNCPWVQDTIDFEIPSSGFTVENGEQLELNIDAQASCEGSGDLGGGSCEVNVAWGDVEGTSGTSKLELKANALADSSVRVHRPGASFTDAEVIEWSPNHRPEFRTMQFTVDVRDAFGRDDIQGVDLILSTPNGANSVFDKSFEDNDLKLDNQGLIGNYTWTYDSGIVAGDYPLQLEINDVQGHTLVFEHSDITFVEHDIYLSLPSSQPDIVLIAPGQTSSIEFLIEHTGSTSSSMNVKFGLVGSPFPSSWSDPVWDQPDGYLLNGGGTFARPILTFDVVDGDLTNAPSSIEIEARAEADTEIANGEQVAIKTIVLSIEESEVLAPPRLAVFEDFEHQIQIADSTRLEAYDETLSHYVDAGDAIGEFFVDVFNAGFVTDSYRFRVTDLPDAWQFKFYDNDTGIELSEDGIYLITPDIGSNQILTIRMDIFPPGERDAQDIGLVEFSVSSASDTALSTSISFTVHRTFGILVEVIADSDGGTLGTVGPVSPGSSMYYNMRITDSSDTLGQTRWRIINPADLERNSETPDGNDTNYGTWDYELSNGTESNIVVINLEADEHADIKLDMKLSPKVEAGFHTVYVRIIEENVDSEEARYFDLPITVEVREEVQPGQLEITDASSEIIQFESNVERNINFRIDNQNNIPLDVYITFDEPNGWDAIIRTSSDQAGGDFLSLTLPAYSSRDFSVVVTPPSYLKNNDKVEIVLTVTPMDKNSPMHNDYKQSKPFSYQTKCSGLTCLLNEIMDPEPETFALGIGLVFVLVFAVYRRGQNAGVRHETNKNWIEDDLSWAIDTVEAIEEKEVEVDEDLELLDELEGI
jgi:hypothetical protein